MPKAYSPQKIAPVIISDGSCFVSRDVRCFCCAGGCSDIGFAGFARTAAGTPNSPTEDFGEPAVELSGGGTGDSD